MKAANRCFSGRLLAALLIVASGMAFAATDEMNSAAGAFRVTYTSSIDPVGINEMHEWTLHVETAEGEPVEDAEIGVGGGMPAHNHGLPTAPRVTENLGGGDYRVQGLRFHMRGQWIVTFEIRASGIEDTVTFNLKL